MPKGGFSLHPLLLDTKVRVTALHQHGDRLYVGTATGQIRVYSYRTQDALPQLELLKTHQIGKRLIDQLGVLAGSQRLVVLSDTIVTLYDLDNLSKPFILNQARSAHCFAHTAVGTKDVLLVGCRKKVVVYGTGKSRFQDGLELSLPHSPRHVVLPPSSDIPEAAFLLYSPTSTVILHIKPGSKLPLSLTDLTTPAAAGHQDRSVSGASQDGSTLSTGVSALTGLGGYVGLGSKVAPPVGVALSDKEVLIGREDVGNFYALDGRASRSDTLHWPAAPDDIGFANHFIYSLVTKSQSNSPSSVGPSSSLQILLAPSLHVQSELSIPTPANGGVSATCLTLVDTSKGTLASGVATSSRMLLTSIPTDKALSQSLGSTIWAVQSDDLGDQVDELVREGRTSDAIGLVNAVGETGFTPSRRLPHLETLYGVQQFARGDFQAAMEAFLAHDVNPALVISLFPAENLSGRLHVSRQGWMQLFGAVDGAKLEPDPEPENVTSNKRLLDRVTQIKKRSSMDTIRSSKDEDPPEAQFDDNVVPRAALEALMYFLSDRRQKLNAPMATVSVPAESSLPPLSSLSAETLRSFPSIPFSEMDPEDLLRMAQIVYTGLIKVYLLVRPILVGSLCRIENWCDVEEVEGLLRAQQKYGDLVDLYHGKKMHAKALQLLHDLAKDENDKLDRYPPTIEYLQKLGPSELKTIFEASGWIFNEDAIMGLSIFTADKAEVEALPRREVMRFLDQLNSGACKGYLEHIINNLDESGAEFHDRLAELYIGDAKTPDSRTQLLAFLNQSKHYRPLRLLSKVPDDLPEAKAILLGRVGRHEEALRIYVYRLQDFKSAEEYCSRAYATEPDPRGIFLTLLRMYLRPNEKDPLLIGPALSLIANHGFQLDAKAVIDLLPPLITLEDVKTFLMRTIRNDFAKRNESRVIKGLSTARKEEVDRFLLDLQVKRVRVTDQRICPQCHKRLGQSAIAVHAPRGEVTHLHCKDLFSVAQNKGSLVA